MTFEDLQRAHDNETPEDDDAPEVCEDCGQRKCVCAQLDEVGW